MHGNKAFRNIRKSTGVPRIESRKWRVVMRSLRVLSALLMAGALVTSPALAARHSRTAHSTVYSQNTNPQTNANLANADALIQNSSSVLNNMQSDQNLANLLHNAKGILIIPNFGQASAGGTANGGVLMQNNNGRWSKPVFFNTGGGSVGIQPAAGGSPVALLIMSDRAMSHFRSGARWSLTPSARLNVVSYSPNAPQPSQSMAQPSQNTAQPSQSTAQPSMATASDVVVWTGTNGANTGNRISITDISANTVYDRAVYGTPDARTIVAGRAPLTNQLAVNLSNQLPAGQTPSTAPRAG
jgi:SH3 domain-containing YSC84-like protein 1